MTDFAVVQAELTLEQLLSKNPNQMSLHTELLCQSEKARGIGIQYILC